jgi:hypothetical protein
MFDFQYRTPWVDRDRFPGGTSVLCAYRRADQRLAGFLGAIVAPYPRPQSYWLALWHVLPELKGTGEGGRLLQRMQAMALDGGSWIGTFGAGPQALPVYLRRGYAVRAVRRWIFSPGDPGDIMNGVPAVSSSLHSSEVLASEHWFAYRYERHPVFRYKRLAGAVFRSEVNAWGVATHVVALSSGGQSECDAVVGVYEQTSCRARELGVPYLMDAWAFERPGRNWSLASEGLPSVFHPPEARGNLIYAVGLPFLPRNVQKGDCDQDRPA